MSYFKNYPSKVFIKFLVRNQLLADSTGSVMTSFFQRQGGVMRTIQFIPGDDCSINFDEESGSDQDQLLAAIYNNTFDPKLRPELYAQSRSTNETLELEQAIAMEIVQSYRRIKSNQANSVVKNLNSLLFD